MENVETSCTTDGSIKWCIAPTWGEIKYPSPDEWIFFKNAVYPYSETVFSHRKDLNTDIYYRTDEHEKQHAQ